MTTVAGTIIEVSIDGRIFTVAADTDAERDLGGMTAEVASNGDGTARKLLTRKPWMVSGLSLVLNDVRKDEEFLEEKAAEEGFYPITVKEASGIVYEGTGSVVGDVKRKSASATGDIGFSGSGKLRRQ